MIIENPEIYIGEKLIVHLNDGSRFQCVGYGYSYDFDENDEEFLELTVVSEKTGLFCDLIENEVVSIEMR